MADIGLAVSNIQPAQLFLSCLLKCSEFETVFNKKGVNYEQAATSCLGIQSATEGRAFLIQDYIFYFSESRFPRLGGGSYFKTICFLYNSESRFPRLGGGSYFKTICFLYNSESRFPRLGGGSYFKTICFLYNSESRFPRLGGGFLFEFISFFS